MKNILILVLLVVVIASCSDDCNRNRSFCYWKTNVSFTASETEMMKQLETGHFYVRFFDVDWNIYEKEAFPVATVNEDFKVILDQCEVTPAVFITNTVLQNATPVQLDTLAGRISRRILTKIEGVVQNYADSRKYTLTYNEKLDWQHQQYLWDSIKPILLRKAADRFRDILIDCDWSVSTREKYFHLLNKLKERLTPYEITSTIRLWQYKYRKSAGIPPVKRGLLMCYSLENPKDPGVENSIVSKDALQKYLDVPPYPCALDIALPIFSWGILFRNNQFERILRTTVPAEMERDTVLYKRVDANRFVVRSDHVAENIYLRCGDEIRVEQLSTRDLTEISGLLKDQLRLSRDQRVSLFSWDTNYLRHYGIQNLQGLFRSLGH